jgi:carbohydrate-selective porin OprB
VPKRNSLRRAQGWAAQFLCLILVLRVSLSAEPQPQSDHANCCSLVQLVSKSNRIREQLATRGFAFSGQLVHDWSKVVGYADEYSEGLGRYSFDLSLAIDTGRLHGWRGGTGFARLKQHQKEFGGEYELSTQLYSNIDAPSRTSFYEFWLQQSLLGGRLRIKAGKIDANSEFAVVQTAADFLNSSMGFSPTIVAFPAYPDPNLAVGLFLRPQRRYGISFGILRTHDMGTMTIVEPQVDWWSRESELHGHASFGYWRLDRAPITGDPDETSAAGVYAIVEQGIWRSAALRNQAQRSLSAHVELGVAENKANVVTHHVGGGLVMQSLLASRPKDSMGIAATLARFATAPAPEDSNRPELAIEIYYKIVLTRSIALIPDSQYFRHPRGTGPTRDCLALTPRLSFVF